MKILTLLVTFSCVLVTIQTQDNQEIDIQVIGDVENIEDNEQVEELSIISEQNIEEKQEQEQSFHDKKQEVFDEQDYEYMIIEDIDPESLNLSYYADKHILGYIFIFGTFGNCIVWALCCCFCNPCCKVLFAIWILAAIFDFSVLLGIVLLVVLCAAQNNINSVTEKFTFNGIRTRSYDA